MKYWHLYIIRCGDGSLYTGIAKNVKKRFEEQKSGSKKSAKYVRGRGPLKLIWKKRIGDKGTALSIEKKVKKLTKMKKEMLVRGKLKLNL